MSQGTERKEDVGLQINVAECQGMDFSCLLVQMSVVQMPWLKQGAKTKYYEGSLPEYALFS